MHCNLRPPDAAPVIIRFNYDVHAKFEVAQLSIAISHSVFTADTLPHVVTLTLIIDLEHL